MPWCIPPSSTGTLSLPNQGAWLTTPSFLPLLFPPFGRRGDPLPYEGVAEALLLFLFFAFAPLPGPPRPPLPPGVLGLLVSLPVAVAPPADFAASGLASLPTLVSSAGSAAAFLRLLLAAAERFTGPLRPVEDRKNSPGLPVIGFSSMYCEPKCWWISSASSTSRWLGRFAAVVLSAVGVASRVLAVPLFPPAVVLVDGTL